MERRIRRRRHGPYGGVTGPPARSRFDRLLDAAADNPALRLAAIVGATFNTLPDVVADCDEDTFALRVAGAIAVHNEITNARKAAGIPPPPGARPSGQ